MNRNYSLDILRILACIGVIVVHTAGGPIFHGWVKPRDMEYAMYTIMEAPTRWSPVFVMLTGFFFLNPQKIIRFFACNSNDFSTFAIGNASRVAHVAHQPAYSLATVVRGCE